MLTLTNKGAADITIQNDAVRFRAERALSTYNPLASCRKGMFRVQKLPQGFCIEHELDLAYLAYWELAGAGLMALIGVPSLLKGDARLLVAPGVILGIVVPLDYAFYAWLAESLFETAALWRRRPRSMAARRTRLILVWYPGPCAWK